MPRSGTHTSQVKPAVERLRRRPGRGGLRAQDLVGCSSQSSTRHAPDHLSGGSPAGDHDATHELRRRTQRAPAQRLVTGPGGARRPPRWPPAGLHLSSTCCPASTRCGRVTACLLTSDPPAGTPGAAGSRPRLGPWLLCGLAGSGSCRWRGCRRRSRAPVGGACWLGDGNLPRWWRAATASLNPLPCGSLGHRSRSCPPPLITEV